MPRKKQIPPAVDEPDSDAWERFKKFRAEVEMFAKLEGKIDGAVEAYQDVILLFGEHFFRTTATKEIRAKVMAVTNRLLVRCVVERLLSVKSWDELMDWDGLPEHQKPNFVSRHIPHNEN